MYSYVIKLDKEKDIQNWYEACTKSSGFTDWTQQIDPKLLEAVRTLTINDAYDLLERHITDLYRIRKDEIDLYIDIINKEYSSKFQFACDTLVQITGKPLYRKMFTIYLTTFPRGPYDVENAALWIAIGWFDPIANFMHEALHFQFIFYWRDSDTAVSKLSVEQFEKLKESLTVVLDESLRPLMKAPDKGYIVHSQIRQKLHEKWIKGANFTELIDYGIELM